jgi:hypothetical protein
LQLVVEGVEPATVAAARGVSRAALVEQLRDAIASLAGRYEHPGPARSWAMGEVCCPQR